MIELASKLVDKIFADKMGQEQIVALVEGAAIAAGLDAVKLYRVAQDIYSQRHHSRTAASLPACKGTEDLIANNID